MAMKLFNDSVYLFESSEVKVFPCSYRGEFENNIIDPEARMLTERNFRVTNEKENRSYIDLINLPDFNTSSLNLSIDGYYFRITCSERLSAYITGGYDTFVISLGDITSGRIITPILKPVYNSNNQDLKLDFKDSTDDKYYFTGLGLVRSTDNTYSGNVKLKVAVYTTDPTPITRVNKDALLSGLNIYQTNNFTYRLIGQQGENGRELKLTLKGNTTTDQIVTTEQDNLTISGNNTFTGKNIFTGDNDFNGANTFSGDNILTGDNDFSGANTFSGNNILTGDILNSQNHTIVTPDYDASKKDYVLSVNNSGKLVWRAPYETEYNNAQ